MDDGIKRPEYIEEQVTNRQQELRLQELRDNQDKVQAGLKYARKLLGALQKKLPEIDQPPEELKALPRERQTEILRARRDIVRALVDKLIIYSNGHIEVQGVIDGSMACLVKQNELQVQ